MKKLLLYMGCAAAMLTACDPNDEFIDKLNAESDIADTEAAFYLGKTVLDAEYTLTDADYALSSIEGISSYSNFSSSATASDNLPEILTNMMVYGETAVEYTVNYNYYKGYSEAFSNYRNKHEVSADEYTAVGGVVADLGYFTADVKSGDKANEILKAAFANAEQGDVQKLISKGAASKSYTFEDISILAVKKFTLEKEDFQVIVDAVLADDANMHLVNEDSNLEFYYGANSKYGNFEGRTSKWAANDEYKDMSEDDLEDLIYARQQEAVMLALKAKFPDATILDTEGNTITYTVAYSAYDGSTRDYLVRYECTAEGAALEFNRIGSMYINTKHELYMFDGADWNVEDDIYRLSSDDYNAMGTDYGFPGKYDNFDSSMDVDYYLTVLLNNNPDLLYTLDGVTKIVAYKYYNSGVTELRTSEYSFTKGMGWYSTPTTVEKSSVVTFKDKVWVVIPPIKFIVSEKTPTISFTLSDEDYAFVGNDYYGNFDEDEDVIIEKIGKIIKNNYADLAVGDVYEVTYNYYNSGASVETIILEAVADN